MNDVKSNIQLKKKNSNQNHPVSHLFARFRAEMKKKNLRYADLAKKIRMSESGLKKIFSSSDVSFSRLFDIGNALGVSLSQFFAEYDSEFVDIEFSQKQQEYFTQFPIGFEVFWKLVYERLEISEVLASTKIIEKDLFKILRQLDKLDLISLLPENRIQIPDVKPVNWKGDNDFLKGIYKDWALRFIKRLAKPKSDPDELFLFRYMKMKESTYQEMIQTIKKIEHEFLMRAIREMQSGHSDLKHVRFLSAVDKRSFYD